MEDYKRLEQIRNSCGIASWQEFADRIGCSAQIFYDIKKEKHGISKSLASKINACFPEFSVSFIFTGKDGNSGEMIETIEVNRDAWEIIKKQADSLKAHDENMSRLIALLERSQKSGSWSATEKDTTSNNAM